MAGFRIYNYQSSGSYSGKVQTFYVGSGHSTRLAPGDWVVLTGTADAKSGLAAVDKAAGTEGSPGLLTGVIVAVDKDLSDLSSKGLPANTAGFVKVYTDPYGLYEAETSAGSTAITDVGTNADIVATASTLSGGLAISNMTVDATTYSAASGQVRLVGLLEPDSLGAGTKVLVRVNESTEKGTAGI